MKEKAKHTDNDKQEKKPAESQEQETVVQQNEKKEETAAEKTVDDFKKEITELENSRLRVLAEMDNLRKRVAKDMAAVRYNVMLDTLTPFLQVFEHFTMAVSAAAISDNYKSLLDGMTMIQKEFDKAFADLGVEKIDASGKDFDPNLHEAVAEEPSDTIPAGKVIRQWSFGYKNGDKLLKPAMVVVSSGSAVKA